MAHEKVHVICENLCLEEGMTKEQIEDKFATKTVVQSLASGSPLVASSVSEMTDTSRVYVNTSDGHWYSYNGSTWQDNGVYQARGIDVNSIEYGNLKAELKNLIDRVEITLGSSVTQTPTKFSQSGYQGIITKFVNPKVAFKDLKILTKYNDSGTAGTIKVGILSGSTSIVAQTHLEDMSFIARGEIALASDNNVITERTITLNSEVNSNEDYLYIAIWKVNQHASNNWLSSSGGDAINFDFVKVPTEINSYFIGGSGNPYVASSSVNTRAVAAFSIIDYDYNLDADKINDNLKSRVVLLENKLNPTEEQPLDNIVRDGGFMNIFKKVVCIGDSLTAGCYEANNTGSTTYNTFSDYGYPAQLRRVLNNDLKVFAKSGVTASSWLSQFSSQAFIEDNLAECYVIALGTNDPSAFGSFTGNISTDIDVLNYNNNANTSVGNYAKIIQMILEAQPKAKIFCCGVPNTRNGYENRVEINTKIQAICELLNVYFMDFMTYGVQPNDVANWKATYYMGGHLNSLGYKQWSNMVASYIDYIIRNNPNDFKQIPFIGTDLSHS